MNGKRIFYSEFAYIVGIVILAVGTAFMERANLGMSMVVAPAYLIYLKLSETVGWFTFGMSEYCLQALLILLLTVILRKFKGKYLFSFCTAVVYGIILDGCMTLVGMMPCGTILLRLVFYVFGMAVCAVGVAFLFHTYIAPEAYELIVKEISEQFHKDIRKVKTIYDCTSCLLAVVLSFVFFGMGHFEGVKIGTIVCALVNGWLIGQVGKFLENCFWFEDALRKRRR